MARDTFEIYYFQNGRWSVHASFESGERDLALAEAQKVDKTLGYPVRLVRETLYPETNTSEEVVSWQSPKAKQLGDPENMFGGGQGKGPAKPQQKKKSPPKPTAPVAPRRAEKPEPSAPTPSAPRTAKKPPPKRKAKGKSKGLTRKVVKVVGASLAISLVIVITAGTLISQLQLVPQEDSAAIGAGIFVVSYVLNSLYFLGKEFDIKFGFRRRRKSEQAAAPRASDMIRKMQVASIEAASNQPDIDVSAMAQANIDDLRENIEQADAEEIADRTGGDEFATAVHDQPQEPPALEPEPAAAAAPEPPNAERAPQPTVTAPPPPPPPPKPAEKKPEPPQADNEARQGMIAFARDALSAATREQPQLNAFSRFGLNLYVAGACNAIGQAKKLPKASQIAILREGLQAAGNTPDRADSFIGELASHGKNPRYAAMIQAGGGAMQRQLAGQRGGSEELTALLADWSKPEKRPSVPSAYTFMFTDIVNSTALTSQLGNAGAQRVVRAHNTAVRGAIQAYQGREVKHTGDGIMATFPSPIAAVQASIRAQKELAAHNAANPATAFTIRIGINIGEAVEEDNDFFGAAVQMTARVCSVCTPANAWVTRAIVDACKGQRVGFIPRGAFQMKGIQQARPLYEIAYTDAHKNGIANL